MANASNNNTPKIINLEEGWNEIKDAIDKLEDMLNGGMKQGTTNMFGPQEYLAIHETCYDMCTQRSPYNWSRELYQRHGETIENYLTTNVLPALQSKNGQGGTILLMELQHRWSNHKIMNKWLRKFFSYLDRYYVKHHSLPTLSQAGLRCFRTHIYDQVRGDTTAAILGLINDEREGQIIDRSLVKSIVELYESMGMGTLDAYNTDLEERLLESTREYYAMKRDSSIEDSTDDYHWKVLQALNGEINRNYLNSSSRSKILRVVKEEMVEKAEIHSLDLVLKYLDI